MKRRLFNLLAAVSLVLCVATVGLWVRSYWVVDVLGHREVSSEHIFVAWSLWSQPGSCGLQQALTARLHPEHGWSSTKTPPNYPDDTWHGFRFQRYEDQTRSTRWWTICIPHWLPALLFAAIPSWWLLSERRRRASLRAVGCCKECGYDLRATPERCPECGAIPADAPRGKIPV